jgi:hypothetical protein
MHQDEEYMSTKRTLPSPNDTDGQEVWDDYFNTYEELNEQDYLESDTHGARHTISPVDWMLGVRPGNWGYQVPPWTSQLYNGNLLY